MLLCIIDKNGIIFKLLPCINYNVYGNVVNYVDYDLNLHVYSNPRMFTVDTWGVYDPLKFHKKYCKVKVHK